MDSYSTPPPIPKQPRNGYHHAALVGLIAPMIVLIIAVALQSVAQGQNPVLAALAGLLILLLIGTGMACSIVALCGIRSFPRTGLLGPGLVGGLLNGAFVILMMVVFILHFNQAAANRRGLQQLIAAGHELSQKAGDDFNPTNGINGQAELKKMDELRKRLSSLTNQLSGDDAVIMGSLNACLAKWEVSEKNFHIAVVAFQQAQVLNFKTLDSRVQLTNRQQAVQNMAAANDRFRASLLNQENELKADLTSRGITGQKLERCMTSFRTSHEPILFQVIQIRDCDKAINEDCRQLLELAEKQWGNWTADPVQKVLFNDEKIQVSAKMLVDDIRLQTKKELGLQGEVIRIQRSSSAALGQRNGQ